MINKTKLIEKAKEIYGSGTFEQDRAKGEKGTDEELLISGLYPLPMLVQACLADETESLNLTIQEVYNYMRFKDGHA